MRIQIDWVRVLATAALLAIVVCAILAPYYNSAVQRVLQTADWRSADTESATQDWPVRIPVCRSGMWGYIDTAGRLVIDHRFRTAGQFRCGLAPVRIGAYFGYVRPDGSLAIDPIYDLADEFIEGRAIVYQNGRAYAIDTSGHVVIGGGGERIDYMSRFRLGFSLCKMASSLCVVNRTGEILAYAENVEVLDSSRLLIWRGLMNEENGRSVRLATSNGDTLATFHNVTGLGVRPGSPVFSLFGLSKTGVRQARIYDRDGTLLDAASELYGLRGLAEYGVGSTRTHHLQDVIHYRSADDQWQGVLSTSRYYQPVVQSRLDGLSRKEDVIVCTPRSVVTLEVREWYPDILRFYARMGKQCRLRDTVLADEIVGTSQDHISAIWRGRMQVHSSDRPLLWDSQDLALMNDRTDIAHRDALLSEREQMSGIVSGVQSVRYLPSDVLPHLNSRHAIWGLPQFFWVMPSRSQDSIVAYLVNMSDTSVALFGNRENLTMFMQARAEYSPRWHTVEYPKSYPCGLGHWSVVIPSKSYLRLAALSYKGHKTYRVRYRFEAGIGDGTSSQVDYFSSPEFEASLNPAQLYHNLRPTPWNED